MSPSPSSPDTLRASIAARLARWREKASRRVIGITAAIVCELLLVLILLTVSPEIEPKGHGEGHTVFTIEPESETPDEQPAKETAKAEPTPRERTPDTPQPPLPPAPVLPITPPPSVAVIPMTSEQMAAADITPRTPSPPAPRRQVAGPPDTGGGNAFADTPRVEGSGPNGEPLYAAAWYREPYPEELRGYLSTANGPGSALIACRTVREWRVEDCILLSENPAGSNIGRAVLAAAWQFKVRPPRLGGELKYGEWVRIRIDYTQR